MKKRRTIVKRNSTPCHYCGMIATGIDHVPPLAIRAAFVDNGLITRWQIKDVPCCKECNSVLGANAPFSLTERRHLVKQYLRRKYAHYLKAPDWTDNELSELGHTLGSMIKNNQLLKETIKLRIDY